MVPGAGATYEVSACGPAGVNRSWEASTTHPTLLNVNQRCPPTGAAESGLWIVDALGGGLRTPVGAVAEWTFTAPPGTAVTRLDSLRWLFTSGDGGWVAYILTAEGQVLEVCQNQLGTGLSCRKGDLVSEPLPLPLESVLPMTPSAGVSIGVTCTTFFGDSCGNGLGIHGAGAGLHAATVTVTDPTPPAIAGVSGPLRDATAGWVRGRLELSVAATDVGGGVGALLVGVDGRPAVTSAVACDYARPAPCPPAASATLGLETATIPDGPHTITAIAQDATRQQPGAHATASPGWVVQTDNTAPATPAGLTATATIAGAPISAGWSVPDQGLGAPIAGARWSLAPADGGAGASAGQVGPEGASSLTGLVAPRPGVWRLEVSLLDAAGNLGAPATIPVPVAASSGSDGPPPAGSAPLTLRSGARPRVVDGRLVVAVNPAGVARRMSIVFRLGSRAIGRRSALVRSGVGVLRVLLPTRALGAPGPVRVSWRRAGVAERYRSLRLRAPAPALRVIGRARLVDRRLVVRVVPHVWPRVARVRLVLGRRVLLIVGRRVPARARRLVVDLRRLRSVRPGSVQVQLAQGRAWRLVRLVASRPAPDRPAVSCTGPEAEFAPSPCLASTGRP